MAALPGGCYLTWAGLWGAVFAPTVCWPFILPFYREKVGFMFLCTSYTYKVHLRQWRTSFARRQSGGMLLRKCIECLRSDFLKIAVGCAVCTCYSPTFFSFSPLLFPSCVPWMAVLWELFRAALLGATLWWKWRQRHPPVSLGSPGEAAPEGENWERRKAGKQIQMRRLTHGVSWRLFWQILALLFLFHLVAAKEHQTGRRQRREVLFFKKS